MRGRKRHIAVDAQAAPKVFEQLDRERLGGGADVRLAGAGPATEPRLRTPNRFERMHDPDPGDPIAPQPHGPESNLPAVQIQGFIG